MSVTLPPLDEELRRMGARIRGLRLRNGWNMEHLAQLSDLSRTTIFHLERGRTPQPRPGTLFSIAQALGVQVDDLLLPEDPPARLGPLEAKAGDALEKLPPRLQALIEGVRGGNPAIFAGWQVAEWQELAELCARLPPANAREAREAAARINAWRETLLRLKCVLQSGLGEVALRLIQALYDELQMHGRLKSSPAANLMQSGTLRNAAS